MMTDLTDLTIAAIRSGVADGEFTATEVAAAFNANVAAASALNAFIVATPEMALEAAAKVDADRAAGKVLGKMAGVPIGMKDLFCTRGVQTTAASHILEGFTPQYESTVSQKLWDAGAGMLGKLNLDQFAMGSSNETSYFGKVISPWRRNDGGNAALAPGGSSGGSSAAIAARLCPAATGTDTGGSIRQPAAFTGISGIKPTYGRCSRWGIVAFASSLDQAGPMARDVRDCAIMLEAMAGFDPKDSTSLDMPVPAWEAGLSADLKGKKIGIPREYRIDGIDADVAKSWDDGIAWLKDAGAEVVDVSLPHTKYALPCYYIIAPAEASSNLARYDGVRYGLRDLPDGAGLQDMYAATRAAGFGPEVKRRIMIGTYVLSAGFYDAYYTQAQKVRTLISRDFTEAFKQCDVILTPTAPSAAFALGEKSADPLEMYLNDVFSVPASLAGLPAMSVPAGLNREGLPLGPAPHRAALRRAGRAQCGAGDRAEGRFRGAGRTGGGKMSSYRIQGMTGEWEVVIGLEVHAQITTKSKLFSGAATAFGAEPNAQVSLVDAAMPGMLPVPNRECIRQAVRTGMAIEAQINKWSRFDRKNYFYADLPQGYQISQLYHPLVGEGQIDISPDDKNPDATKTIGIERIHVEQDAGKLMHDQHPTMSYVDLNRSGVALMEIVSRPDLRSPAEAGAYLRKLRSILRYVGSCDGNMEEGSMRADVNVSVRRPGDEFGTRTETKNVNSVRFVMSVVESEARRQVDLIEDGGKVVQETRLYDPDKNETRSMRSKEDAHDYRYFPDPDLLPLELDDAFLAECRASLPELPDAKRARYAGALGLSPYNADILTAEVDTARWFERLVSATAERQNKSEADVAKQAANWLTSELFGALNRLGKSLDDSPGHARSGGGTAGAGRRRHDFGHDRQAGVREDAGDRRRCCRHRRARGPQADQLIPARLMRLSPKCWPTTPTRSNSIAAARKRCSASSSARR